ncbi:MAG TPA: PAS domain-containing sensor histidine kinase [Burkholderiaceae bacterium]|nr:PAS domain-containing sensor histidine kinase [Burkholderiaceae bacterium]
MAPSVTPQVERLLTALLDQSFDHALLLFGTDERIVWASVGAERIFGRPADALVGLANADLFVAEDVEKGIPGHELAVARSHGSAEDDRWTKRPDGSRFWALGLAYSLRDEAGQVIGYGKILQNRSDWKQQQESFRNRIDEFVRLDEQKNLMIATLAHELRSPLAPLMNAAHLLRRGAPVEQSVRLIERQVDAIGRLVNDLLDATRASSGKVRLRVEPLVLQDVLSEAVETVQPLVDQHRHRLEVLLPSGPIHLDGDALRLQQVFVNLLTNAVKYTPDGGSIWLKATIEDGEAVVRVEDKGLGIPPGMLSHIFELFAQVQSPAAAEGLGIGLSLVKELVTLHGGTVQANSDGLGKGSEFIVRLPRSRQ